MPADTAVTAPPAGAGLDAGERAWLAGLDPRTRAAVTGLLDRAYAAGVVAGAAGERARSARLERLAYLDPLTGLANRAGLQTTAAAAFHPAAGGGRVGGLLVDLDRFKPVNDTHGHHIGDQVLTHAASRLQAAAAAAGGTAARLGGDEFVILLPALAADPDTAGRHALQVAETIAAALGGPYEVEGLVLQVSGSIGVATVPAAASLGSLLAAADLAMYAAKRAGGGVQLAPDTAHPGTVVDLFPPAPRRPQARLRDDRAAFAAGGTA